MSNQKVLLTQGQIDQWRKEKGEYEGTIADAQQRLAEVNRMLDAAAVLLGPDWDASSSQEKAGGAHTDEDNLEPLTEAVLRIVRERGGTEKRFEIKAALRKAGYPENRLGNYFYTVMSRHVERGNLIKKGDRFSLARQREPSPEKEEAPSDSPRKDLLSASIETGLAVQ